MKYFKFIIVCVFIGFTFNLDAQDVKYSGGDGDGFASSSYFLIGYPTSFSVTAGGIKQIDLTWVKSSNEDVIIVYNTSNTFGTPVNSTVYSINDAIPDGGTVIYNGIGTSTTQGDLSEGSTYYYKIWSNSSSSYSEGSQIGNATTIAGSSTVPISLSATETGVQTITLSWALNGSSDNVMLAYSTDGVFGTPIDGDSYSVSGTISGGGTVLLNNSNTSYEHKYLTGGSYYYKAWSVNTNLYSSGITDNITIMSAAEILARYSGSDGGGYGSAENGAGSLPVELTSFTASSISSTNETISTGTVVLNWETATEVNNYGFQVERKKGKVESEIWEEVGFVEGHGNSNSQKDYSYVDSNPISGINRYRLKQIDTDGEFEYSEIVEVEVDIPIVFKLSQNFPNPFNPTTEINYSIPNVGTSGSVSSTNVSLKIYDILGREVATLVNKKQTPGNYSVAFNASQLSSGIYFYSIRTDVNASIKKMILLK